MFTTWPLDEQAAKDAPELAAALQLNPKRRVILSEAENFPTDLYIAQGLIAQLGQGHELRLVTPDQMPAESA